MLGAALACASCAGLRPAQHALWVPESGPLTDLTPQWNRVHETIIGGVRFKVMNNTRSLRLRFETDESVLREEFSGLDGQSLLVWFSSGNFGHGLRIDFKPRQGVSLAAGWNDPLADMTEDVTLCGPPAEGYPRDWLQGSEGIDVSAFMESGAVVYDLKVPLRPPRPGRFGLGLKPGQSLLIDVRTTGLSPDLGTELDPGVDAAVEATDDGVYGSDLDPSRPVPYDGGSLSEEQAPSNYAAVLKVALALPPRR